MPRSERLLPGRLDPYCPRLLLACRARAAISTVQARVEARSVEQGSISTCARQYPCTDRAQVLVQIACYRMFASRASSASCHLGGPWPSRGTTFSSTFATLSELSRPLSRAAAWG